MDMKDESFFKKLLATFKVEAQEHIAALSAGLIGLEKTSAPEEQVKIIPGGTQPEGRCAFCEYDGNRDCMPVGGKRFCRIKTQRNSPVTGVV
jgi:hypothetical protein